MKRLNVDELIIEATRFCNLDCAHCFRGEATTEYMDPNTICNIFENIGLIKKLVISNDKFHQMSIERLGLTDKRKVNFEILKKLYNSEYYQSPEDNKDTIFCDAGRARNITKEELEEINKWGSVETNYSIINPDFKYWDEIGAFTRFAHTVDDEHIKGVVDIDVDGYLVNMYVSYIEVKDYHNEYVNINEVGLLNSIKNFSPYFNEVHENYKRLNKSKTYSRMN